MSDGFEVCDGLVVGVIVGRAVVGGGVDRLEVVLVGLKQLLAQVSPL